MIILLQKNNNYLSNNCISISRVNDKKKISKQRYENDICEIKFNEKDDNSVNLIYVDKFIGEYTLSTGYIEQYEYYMTSPELICLNILCEKY